MVATATKSIKKRKTEPTFASYISKLHKRVHGSDTDLTLASGTVSALDAMAEYTIDQIMKHAKIAMRYEGGSTFSPDIASHATVLMLTDNLRNEAKQMGAQAVETLKKQLEEDGKDRMEKRRSGSK